MNGLTSLRNFPDSIGDMTSLTQFVMNNVSPRVSVIEKTLAIRERLNLLGGVEHRVHDSSGCSSLMDLVGLTCSEPVLKDLQNVWHLEDAERLKLRDKSDIQVLALHWENEGSKSLLDRLLPPRTLEQFFLFGYTRKDFPNWMRDISSYLPFLSEVTLDGLEACDCLPPFGALPNLRSLSLKNNPNIRKIGKELYGKGGPCMKLRVIELESMENLVEWWTTKSSEENEEFLIPNLHYLDVHNCPKLYFLPYPPRSMNWKLKNSSLVLPRSGFGKLSSCTVPCEMDIGNCSFSQGKWDRLQHLHTFENFRVSSVSGLRILPEVMRCFTSLKDLYLASLEDLETLPVWLGHLGSLELFGMEDCCNVIYLPESMKNLTALRNLKLDECRRLEILPGWLGQLTSLEKIYIKDCPKLTYLPESTKDLSALRDLILIECKGLEILPGWLGQLTSLKKIYIKDCPKLTCLPESTKYLTALRNLTLIECEGLELLPGCLGQLTSLENIYVKDCPKLTYLPESTSDLTALRDLTLIECEGLEILPRRLGQLTSLEEMYINKCPKITSLPESIRSLTALRDLRLIGCEGLEILPGWLGQLTSLENFYIAGCPKLTSLPESIRSLTALKELKISLSPSLIARCLEEDAHNISHIPTVEFMNVLRQRWVTLGEAQQTERAEFSVESAAEKLLEPFRRPLLLIAEEEGEGEGEGEAEAEAEGEGEGEEEAEGNSVGIANAAEFSFESTAEALLRLFQGVLLHNAEEEEEAEENSVEIADAAE